MIARPQSLSNECCCSRKTPVENRIFQCACSITHNFMKAINRLRELFGRCLA